MSNNTVDDSNNVAEVFDVVDDSDAADKVVEIVDDVGGETSNGVIANVDEGTRVSDGNNDVDFEIVDDGSKVDAIAVISGGEISAISEVLQTAETSDDDVDILTGVPGISVSFGVVQTAEILDVVKISTGADVVVSFGVVQTAETSDVVKTLLDVAGMVVVVYNSPKDFSFSNMLEDE